MDNDSISALKLLETIGECNAILSKLSSELQKRPEVSSTERTVECRSFPVTGTSLDLYLDVELKNGNCVTYFLGLSWNENEWLVTARISINDVQGYMVIKDFPVMRTEHFDELLHYLVGSASELQINSAIITVSNGDSGSKSEKNEK